ncbi:MAG: DUF4386 domain-containing protein [Candidatus Hermodarchaeota archaeon]
MNIEIFISGFLYLLILVLQIVMAIFGYILEPMPKHYETDVKLQNINKDPKKFKIGIIFALIEHFCVIILPIMLFIAFNHYNIILGIIWMIFRIIEGSTQVYIENDYWRLLNISKNYSINSETEKSSLFNSYRNIIQKKSSRFAFAMICWSIGTLTFSIVLVTYGVAPSFIGWLGIVASILIGFSNLIKLVKPKFKAYQLLSSFAGLLSIVFEVLIGGWLLWYSFMIP